MDATCIAGALAALLPPALQPMDGLSQGSACDVVIRTKKSRQHVPGTPAAGGLGRTLAAGSASPRRGRSSMKLTICTSSSACSPGARARAQRRRPCVTIARARQPPTTRTRTTAGPTCCASIRSTTDVQTSASARGMLRGQCRSSAMSTATTATTRPAPCSARSSAACSATRSARATGARPRRSAGAVVGGAVGNNVAQPATTAATPAPNVVAAWSRTRPQERRIVGYDVEYRYRGEVYMSRLTYDPGDRMRVRVSGRRRRE